MVAIQRKVHITITAQGFVPKGKALFRHNAKVGDLIYVSGTLGDSAAGLIGSYKVKVRSILMLNF